MSFGYVFVDISLQAYAFSFPWKARLTLVWWLCSFTSSIYSIHPEKALFPSHTRLKSFL